MIQIDLGDFISERFRFRSSKTPSAPSSTKMNKLFVLGMHENGKPGLAHGLGCDVDAFSGVQAYLAGLTFALAVSPCSTAVLATLLGYVAASKGKGHRVMTVSPRYDQYKDAWDTHVLLQIKIGDRIETVRFFHCYKRGVDRVFVDHPMFLEKAEECLKREKDRVAHYLHSSSELKLLEHKDVTKRPVEETPEITPTVDEAVLSPVNQDTITPLPSESDTMEPKEMLLSDEEKERNSAEEEKLAESPIDEEAAHNSVPSLEHNNEIRGVSLDLLKYIDSYFEGPALYPDDPTKREFAEELLSYTNTFNLAVITSLKEGSENEISTAFDYLESALFKFTDGPFFLGEKGLFALAPPHQRIDRESSDGSGVIVYKLNEKNNRPNTGSVNWKKRWS
ncbi:unnamed protein product [Camellia sinensis]